MYNLRVSANKNRCIHQIQHKIGKTTIKVVIRDAELLFGFLEDGIPTVTAGVSVAVICHEVASSTSVTEWEFALQLSILDLIVLAYSVRHYSSSFSSSVASSAGASSSGSGSGSG